MDLKIPNFNALIFGDIHFPFEEKHALKEVIEESKRIKPNCIIQMGDLFEQYNFSNYPKSSIILPLDELKLAKQKASQFWETLRTLHPKAKLIQLKGNHDDRASKRVLELLPSLETLYQPAITKLYNFPGVVTIHDSKVELTINGIFFHHGHKRKLGDHMAYNLHNTTVAHSHVGGIVFKQFNQKILWELNVGYLADQKQVPLRYSEQQRKLWTLGYGTIQEKRSQIFAPAFVPLR